MRRLREAARMSGFLRSCFVIELMIAIWRSNIRSSRPLSAICFFIFWTPGSRPIMPSMPPMRFICASWSDIISRSN
jgi:hypothetical protein